MLFSIFRGSIEYSLVLTVKRLCPAQDPPGSVEILRAHWWFCRLTSPCIETRPQRWCVCCQGLLLCSPALDGTWGLLGELYEGGSKFRVVRNDLDHNSWTMRYESSQAGDYIKEWGWRGAGRGGPESATHCTMLCPVGCSWVLAFIINW